MDLVAYKNLLSTKTKLVAVTAQSNVTGTITPVKKITSMAHTVGAKVLIDAAQSIGHMTTNVKNIDCEFLAFSAHKMLGPMGVGVLYVKEKLINEMTPYLYGGDMVVDVDQYGARYHSGYAKFEAGTPDVAGVVAMGAAIDYLESIGMNSIVQHDQELIKYAIEKFSSFSMVKLYHPKRLQDCGAVLSFTVNGIHPHDLSTIFDQAGVAIRSGFHCAQPLVRRLGAPSTARLSFYIYNTKADIDVAVKALQKAFKIFKVKN
ncbi:MAG: hypothetical protein ACD_72C00437G0004 [uncultured bacterium]|nr:MAG: hypothetical protein ACD_72C00437G0004 [uncultured bacterium]